jgi:hypothetical protein
MGIETIQLLSTSGGSGNIQAELDNTQDAMEWIGQDGEFIQPSGTNYIDTATSPLNVSELLDQKIFDIYNLVSANITNIQLELDNTQLHSGLDSAGNYIQPVGTSYIDSSISLYNAILLLDTEIKTVNDNSIGSVNNPTDGDLVVFNNGEWISVKPVVEPPIENPDGIINTFTIPNSYLPNTLRVYVNGLLETDFTETSNNSITLNHTLEAGDEIEIEYLAI